MQSAYVLDEDNWDREIGNLLMAPESAHKLMIFAEKALQNAIPPSIKGMNFEEFLLDDFLN